MRHLESQTQISCVRWFRNTYPEYADLLFSVPNGGQRSATEASIMRAEGIVPGVSDLILMMPVGGYHAICIEMKRITYLWENGKEKARKGRQSKDQKKWQKLVNEQGYGYFIIYTREQFEELIEGFLGKRY